eukprot:gene2476-5428_t
MLILCLFAESVYGTGIGRTYEGEEVEKLVRESFYGTGIGRTYQGEELEKLVRQVEHGLGDKTLEADQPWDCPERVLNPWSLRGKQLVLVVVVSHVESVYRRAVLRQTYCRHKSGYNFDLSFAVGHPYHEVAQYESQLLPPAVIAVGHPYNEVAHYKSQYIVEWILPTHGYQYLLKMDDDTYVHFPHFFQWMKTMRVAFTNTPNVMFGSQKASRPYFYLGAFYGFSMHLVKEVVHKVEPRFRGGKHEDQLAGAWVRMYSSNVTDIEIDEDKAHPSSPGAPK